MRPHMPLITLALTLVVVGRPAAAQESPRARAQSLLSAEVFAKVDALARAAEQDGIPGDILFSKALEGNAKHVPAERIVPAVQAYSGRLQEARTAFGPGAGGPLLIAGADALQRGVGAELLQSLGRNPARSPTACLVLADLVETGVAGEQALGLVREAMRLRSRDQQMLDMSAQVRRLMRQGESAINAVDQVRRSLQRGRGGGVTAPVAPGSEPTTQTRRRAGGGG
jgi:hypothetical protein